jgi:energy-coupling factor transport system permease protein
MDSEIYLDRNTPVHRLDPRTKIALMVLCFVAPAYYQNPLWVAPVAVLVLLHGLLSRSLGNLRRMRHLMIILGVSSFVLWNLFTKGETRLFGFVYQESLAFSVGRTIMMLTVIAAGMIFLSTTRNEEFVTGLIRLGLPYRVGFAISTALRMVPTIIGSVWTVVEAQKSRGHDLDAGGLVQRIRNHIPLLIPVFVSSIRNTHTFSMALESKAFGARRTRTYWLDPRFKPVDYVVLGLTLLLFALATGLKIAGYGMIAGLRQF